MSSDFTYRERYKGNAILELTFQFSLDIMSFLDASSGIHPHHANQLFKSGTSIGANVKEAQNAESLNDFIHKMKIAAKEADETEYWLLLLARSGKHVKIEELCSNLDRILKTLNKIISSSRKRSNLKEERVNYGPMLKKVGG